MKKHLNLLLPAYILIVISVLSSCKKEPLDSADTISPPHFVLTDEVSAISSSQAISGITIPDDGKPINVVGVGICWNTNPDPVYNTNYGSFRGKWVDKPVNNYGHLTYLITDLYPSTKYYARAYAKNRGRITYGNQIVFTTSPSLQDIEGREYGTVTIGSQVWMADELETTKFNDGKPIPCIENLWDWNKLDGPGYYFYFYSWGDDWWGYNQPIKTLYNWQTVNTGKLCPQGWHVPTDGDWMQLASYVDPDFWSSGQQDKMDGTYTDSYLFEAGKTVILDTISGIVGWNNSTFEEELAPQWWSSTPYSVYTASAFVLDPNVLNKIYSKKYGLPVRCIKDN